MGIDVEYFFLFHLNPCQFNRQSASITKEFRKRLRILRKPCGLYAVSFFKFSAPKATSETPCIAFKFF